MWETEKFVTPFKDSGYAAIYVNNKEAYIKALRDLGPHDVLIFSSNDQDLVVFLSDSRADFKTFVFKNGKPIRSDHA